MPLSDTQAARALNRFSKVKEAREALKEQALELFNTYVLIINQAINDKDYETAHKATQWLIEHMPAEDGVRMIDSSASRPKESEQKSLGPAIQIGIALSGQPPRKALPPVEVIDVTDDKRTKR
jgi:hypothetical protein